ncbi:hypothetical protein BDV26DRAFT_288300 [Aspergillus bertholletiae]|uniref:NAD(P)-binding domain-containing protein n=1 Tax=Aspergillus bertholletiae TaxID=1226010 RepID=A0A5N7BLX5_9EURO|nr:hypothetical protein BDV26DRAFT_288300 [Aspergillus bertholletiae]
MRSYAVLGGTGSTGSRIINQLLKEEDVQLNVYARSKAKLEEQIPLLIGSPRAQIFTGSITNTDILADCLDGVHAIFLAIGTNYNEPDCTLVQQVASSLVASLQILRSRSQRSGISNSTPWSCPTLVLLSSAGVHAHLFAQEPLIFKFLTSRGCYYIYKDLELAEKFLRGYKWLPLVVVHPGGLVHDRAYGVRIGENEGTDRVGYDDLAMAMILAADGKATPSDKTIDRTKWVGKGVGVVSFGGDDVAIPTGNMKYLLTGICVYWFPFLWHVFKVLGVI